MGLTYLRNTCMPGFLESTQGRGHLKSCLLGPRPALTGLAGAALGDPLSPRGPPLAAPSTWDPAMSVGRDSLLCPVWPE